MYPEIVLEVFCAIYFELRNFYAPRIDELDPDIIYYWCNIRTEGSLKNRQAEKLSESTHAEGTTNRFQGELLGNTMDFNAMGHFGPAAREEKTTKAR